MVFPETANGNCPSTATSAPHATADPSGSELHSMEPMKAAAADKQAMPDSQTDRGAHAGHGASFKRTPCRETLHQHAQQLIEDINNKRKQDTKFMEDFKTALEMNVQKTLGSVEQNIFLLYNQQSQKIQTILQELFETLDRVQSIEVELGQFRNVLGSLYDGVQTND